MIYCYYTDGSSRATKTGAYGFIRCDNETYSKVATEEKTTNQRMELRAIIEACKDAYSFGIAAFDEVQIYSDSAYVINCYKQRWYDKWQVNGWHNSKMEPVANKDLWIELIPYFENPNFNFIKVKGHANDSLNNKIDALVQAASKGDK